MHVKLHIQLLKVKQVCTRMSRFLPLCCKSEHWERGSPFLMSWRLVLLWDTDKVDWCVMWCDVNLFGLHLHLIYSRAKYIIDSLGTLALWLYSTPLLIQVDLSVCIALLDSHHKSALLLQSQKVHFTILPYSRAISVLDSQCLTLINPN